MTRVRHAIRRFIFDRNNEGATVEEIAEALGYTPQQVADAMSILSSAGQIQRTQEERGKGLAGAAPVWIIPRLAA